MDLGTVLMDLRARRYGGPQALLRDVELIWANCEAFNEPGSAIAAEAGACRQTFARMWRASGIDQPAGGEGATAPAEAQQLLQQQQQRLHVPEPEAGGGAGPAAGIAKVKVKLGPRAAALAAAAGGAAPAAAAAPQAAAPGPSSRPAAAAAKVPGASPKAARAAGAGMSASPATAAPAWHAQATGALRALMRADVCQLFNAPVDVHDVPDYYQVHDYVTGKRCLCVPMHVHGACMHACCARPPHHTGLGMAWVSHGRLQAASRRRGSPLQPALQQAARGQAEHEQQLFVVRCARGGTGLRAGAPGLIWPHPPQPMPPLRPAPPAPPTPTPTPTPPGHPQPHGPGHGGREAPQAQVPGGWVGMGTGPQPPGLPRPAPPPPCTYLCMHTVVISEPASLLTHTLWPQASACTLIIAHLRPPTGQEEVPLPSPPSPHTPSSRPGLALPRHCHCWSASLPRCCNRCL